LFERGCDAGNMQSCGALGDAYYDGQGMPPNRSQALALYKKSCDGGWAAGCEALAERGSEHSSGSTAARSSGNNNNEQAERDAQFHCELEHNGWCGHRCVSLDSSQNCGRCGNYCNSYQKCINRTCENTGNAD